MKIELAPMDYYFYRPSLYTIQFAFEYETKISTERLMLAVQQLTQEMPIIGSRLIKLSNFQLMLETGFHIPVREQYINESIINNTDHFFDSITNTEGEPLIKILVSQTNRKSYVGISFSHLLGDGTTFFMFMKNLVLIIAGKKINSVSIDRSILNAFIKNNLKKELFESTGYIQPRPKNPTHVDVEHIHYTKNKINQLKDELKQEGCFASSNDIIMADLIKKYYQHIPKHQNKWIVRCPVDYRKTIGIGDSYFGNAVRDAISFFDKDELDTMKLSEVVERIRQNIHSIDLNSIQESLTALDYLRQSKGVDSFQDLGCPGLLVSNLSKFPISKINLGNGSPTGFYHASLNPRVALILPHTDGFLINFKRPHLNEYLN